MSHIATLTKTGRAALVKAVSTRPLFLAWGTGDPAWDAPGAELPTLVNATALVNEVGRRIPATVALWSRTTTGLSSWQKEPA